MRLLILSSLVLLALGCDHSGASRPASDPHGASPKTKPAPAQGAGADAGAPGEEEIVPPPDKPGYAPLP